MDDLQNWQYIAAGLIFIWTGFVRSGLGFGGAALGLPLLLLVGVFGLLTLPSEWVVVFPTFRTL